MGFLSCCFPKDSPREQFSDAAGQPAPKAAAPAPQAPASHGAAPVPPAMPVMPQPPAVQAPMRQGVNNMNGGAASPFVPSLNTNAAIEVVEKDFARQAAREKKKQEEAAKKAEAKAMAKAAAMGVEYKPPSQQPENGANHGAHTNSGGASKPNGPEVLVKDGDPKCKAGTPVMVADKWLSVPYFQQFQGLTGTLTRRGVSGVTWYAQFPGLFEQAFSTGMHSQYVLCYAPDEGPQKKERKHKKGTDKNPIAPPPRANKGNVEAPMSSAMSVTSTGGYKQRPGTARSRAAMGAPPLNSHRSMGPLKSARYSVVGSMKDGGNVTNRDNPKQGRMFKYPEWDEYELFDSDDLWSEHVYVLYGENGPGGGAKVYVWIGQYNEYCDYNQNASCKSLAEKAVAEFRAHMGGWPVASISFVKELKETEEFWDYFLLG